MGSEKKKFRVIQIDGYADASSRLMELNNSALIVDKTGGIYLGNATDEANAYPIKVAIAEKDLENYVIVDELLEVEETTAAALIDLNDRKADRTDVSALVLDLDKYLTKEEFIETEEVIADAITHLENNKVDNSTATELYSLIGEKANATDLDYYATVGRMTAAENTITSLLGDVEDLSTKLDTKADASLFDQYATKEHLLEVEYVTSAALNDLNNNKVDNSTAIELYSLIGEKANATDLNSYATKTSLDVVKNDVSLLRSNLSDYATTEQLIEVECVAASALTDLDNRKADKNIATKDEPGLVKPTSVIQIPAVNSISSEAGRYYWIQMAETGEMFVNVPKEEVTNVIPSINATYNIGSDSSRFVNGYFSGSVYAGSGFYQSSDENLKNFKSDIEIDFNKLQAIPKKYFTWKFDKDEKLQLGTSAQEIQKIYPEVVWENEAGSLMVDYAKLSVIALAAIDNLNKRIEELENKIK